MNPRGRVPVLKDGDFVVFESLACLLYLDRKYPEPPLFGRTPEEAALDHAGDLRVPGLRRRPAHADRVGRRSSNARTSASRRSRAPCTIVAGEARTIEGRLSKSDWLVGEHVSAADMVVFPGIMLLLRALEKREARRPALALPADGGELSGDRAAGSQRVESLPGLRAAHIRRTGARARRAAEHASACGPRA